MVPELEQGVGVCPSRAPGLGHVWAGAMATGDARNPCKFCDTSGRAFFAAATAARAAMFANIEPPKSVKTWGKS